MGAENETKNVQSTETTKRTAPRLAGVIVPLLSLERKVRKKKDKPAIPEAVDQETREEQAPTEKAKEVLAGNATVEETPDVPMEDVEDTPPGCERVPEEKQEEAAARQETSEEAMPNEAAEEETQNEAAKEETPDVPMEDASSTATKAELEIIEQEEAACKQLEEMIEASAVEIARLTKMAREAQALLAKKRLALKPKIAPAAQEAKREERAAATSTKNTARQGYRGKRTRPVEVALDPTVAALAQKDIVNRLLEKKEKPKAALKGYVLPPKSCKETRSLLEKLAERTGCIPHIVQTRSTTWFIADPDVSQKIHRVLMANGITECTFPLTKGKVLKKLAENLANPDTPGRARRYISEIIGQNTATEPRIE
ncbi:MAG: uncharacterized protein A8A55_2667 [Amphiamblys sp. WSBS2006]|nr:MAG: uncharacterized protein A8A55_2667 [Amphiamblys sp. WSBS2006]